MFDFLVLYNYDNLHNYVNFSVLVIKYFMLLGFVQVLGAKTQVLGLPQIPKYLGFVFDSPNIYCFDQI